MKPQKNKYFIRQTSDLHYIIYPCSNARLAVDLEQAYFVQQFFCYYINEAITACVLDGKSITVVILLLSCSYSMIIIVVD